MELALTPSTILGDRVQLQQVIINLVMNGIEAMQSVTERARELVIRSRQDETGQVLVSVTDCGVGISAENANRLFQRLFHHQIQRHGYGTSDLSFDRGSSRGRLSASGNDGPGATFQFVLPVHREERRDRAPQIIA